MELDEPIPCHVCRMLLNGRDQYDDHLKGKRHRKNKRKQRRQGLAVPGSDDNDHAPRDKAIKLDKTGCLAGPSDAEQKDLAPAEHSASPTTDLLKKPQREGTRRDRASTRGRHGFASRHEEAAHKQRFASASSHTARLPGGPLRLLQQEIEGSGVSVCANALTRAGLPPAHSPLQGIKHRPNKESVSRLPALRQKARAPGNNRVRQVPRPAPNSLRKLNIALNRAVRRALRGRPPKNFRRIVRLWPTTVTWPPQFEVAQNFAQPAENLTAPSGDVAKRSDTSPAPKGTARTSR